ncbi:hypothetical protein [Massilia sp. DD77]|uniref:hypothetical protein n=1 Tax=Massilia sp. DD77 TaxID=3109349 RepID=UPI002FFE2D50
MLKVDALSTSAELDQFIGEELTLTMLQPDGARRAWHTLCRICLEVNWLPALPGQTTSIRPWL